jgi:3-phenylpropionate/trans-cinnamate dioxygenase ferredoxin reductase subunit
MAVDDVFAAGDVARFPHALYEYELLALEHWQNAVVGAQVAAHNMICDDPGRRAHVSVPAFWSVQFGTNIKSVGVPALASQIPTPTGSTRTARTTSTWASGAACTTASARRWPG